MTFWEIVSFRTCTCTSSIADYSAALDGRRERSHNADSPQGSLSKRRQSLPTFRLRRVRLRGGHGLSDAYFVSRSARIGIRSRFELHCFPLPVRLLHRQRPLLPRTHTLSLSISLSLSVSQNIDGHPTGAAVILLYSLSACPRRSVPRAELVRSGKTAAEDERTRGLDRVHGSSLRAGHHSSSAARSVRPQCRRCAMLLLTHSLVLERFARWSVCVRSPLLYSFYHYALQEYSSVHRRTSGQTGLR